MIETDTDYKAAIASDLRSIDIFLGVGYGIDNTAADDMTSITAGMLPMSNRSQITDAVYSLGRTLATFEGDGIPTDPSEGVCMPPLDDSVPSIETAIWSDVISGSDGSMDWTVTLSFGRVHESALTLYSGGVVTITKATVSFLEGGSTVHSETVEVSSGENIHIDQAHRYDTLTIRVLSIDKAYCHARIAEMEFGSSVTLSNNAIRGEVRLVSEKDATEQRCPLDEVTFEVINEGWIFDFDSPSRENESVSVGKPLLLSFRVATASGYRTIPCGKYYIRDIDMSEGSARVTADDPRVIMTDVMEEWSIPQATSIGEAMDTVCDRLLIAHLCDTSLYSMYPPRDLSFGSSTTYMEDVLNVLQLMGLEMHPQNDGILRFTTTTTPQSYGAVEESRMLSYPQKKTNLSTYNMVSVTYGEDRRQSYVSDLRTTSSASLNMLRVDNPLVMTEGEAKVICDRIVANLYNSELDVEWRGDPALQVGDMVSFPGRFSDATPRRVEYQELTFNGGLSARTSVVY